MEYYYWVATLKDESLLALNSKVTFFLEGNIFLFYEKFLAAVSENHAIIQDGTICYTLTTIVNYLKRIFILKFRNTL